MKAINLIVLYAALSSTAYAETPRTGLARRAVGLIGGTTLATVAVTKFNEFISTVQVPTAGELPSAYCGRATDLGQKATSCEGRRDELKRALEREPQRGSASADLRGQVQELSQALREVLARQQSSGRQTEAQNQGSVLCRPQLDRLVTCLDEVDRLLAGARTPAPAAPAAPASPATSPTSH